MSTDVAPRSPEWIESAEEAVWPRSVDLFVARFTSPHTIDSYRRSLQSFIEAAQAEDLPSPAGLTAGFLASYHRHLVARGLAPATLAREVRTTRSYLKWLSVWFRNIPPEPHLAIVLPAPRVNPKAPKLLPAGQRREMLDPGAVSFRDRAILELLMVCGLRPGEVSELQTDDVRLDEKGAAVLRVVGAGASKRIVPLPEETALMIASYLVESGRRFGSAGPLFVADDSAAKARGEPRCIYRKHRARGLSRRSIYNISRQAGVGSSPFSLRHSAGLDLRARGADSGTLQDVLGLSPSAAAVYSSAQYRRSRELLEESRRELIEPDGQDGGDG